MCVGVCKDQWGLSQLSRRGLSFYFNYDFTLHCASWTGRCAQGIKIIETVFHFCIMRHERLVWTVIDWSMRQISQ